MTALSDRLERLADLAEKATPGPWRTDDTGGRFWRGGFIAAASPSVVRALVEVARAARRVMEYDSGTIAEAPLREWVLCEAMHPLRDALSALEQAMK